MTSRDLVLSVEEGDAHRFSSMSEGYVYLYLRYHADKKGVFRLAMTELAAMLNVNRQTVLKHVETLMEKRLVARQGHGRYRVHAEPWSIREAARACLAELNEGDELLVSTLAKRAYGEDLDYGAAADDPREKELFEYLEKLEKAKMLRYDEMNGTYHRTGRMYL